MPHSNFKERFHQFNLGTRKCPFGQTFEYTSERDMKMKHHRFCSNPPVAIDKIRVPTKACMLREQQLNEAERMRKVHNEPCGVPLISIYLDKYYYADCRAGCKHRNQEATLYLQELTLTLLIQMPSQVHPLGNTSHDYQGFP